jgi:transcriptional regulator with XRE-family HTH domain
MTQRSPKHRTRPAPSPVEQHVGPRLRELRLERGYRLKEVAQGTGLSISFLSMLENGACDITLGRLLKLVAFYRVGIADLVPDEWQQPKDDSIVRRNERRKISSPSEGVSLYLLAPDGTDRRAMTPELVVYTEGAEIIDFDSHEGDEFIFFVSGSIELIREGHEPAILRAGDSAYYSARIPHRHRNVGKRGAKVLAAVTPARL